MLTNYQKHNLTTYTASALLSLTLCFATSCTQQKSRFSMGASEIAESGWYGEMDDSMGKLPETELTPERRDSNTTNTSRTSWTSTFTSYSYAGMRTFFEGAKGVMNFGVEVARLSRNLSERLFRKEEFNPGSDVACYEGPTIDGGVFSNDILTAGVHYDGPSLRSSMGSSTYPDTNAATMHTTEQNSVPVIQRAAPLTTEQHFAQNLHTVFQSLGWGKPTSEN